MEFEHLLFGLIVTVILSVPVSIAVCSINDNATMERMVKGGANPIAAQCAVRGIATNNREICIAVIANPQKQ
ncbi:hypothetical protein BZ21_768 [Yersinia pseudotuberculosis]|uniref:hypothetical protein n=1 Tax=Yersinia pseudotuberculosis TaxID=633 RepID=UPI0005AD64F8|nr:hypothetical protein [Yersinia pseudotuberculosis]AJJ01333.1 hypothetical protein BZ21_768 [Yersinia pseudotuberculosis]CNJ99562.1 Uncharacterised protein [Yersinia pseudotuberculosis]CQH39249.1 Uncharacterised protein [Yersinia pseudotuberculosis]